MRFYFWPLDVNPNQTSRVLWSDGWKFLCMKSCWWSPSSAPSEEPYSEISFRTTNECAHPQWSWCPLRTQFKNNFLDSYMKSKGSFYEPKNSQFQAGQLMGGYSRLSPQFAVHSLTSKNNKQDADYVPSIPINQISSSSCEYINCCYTDDCTESE